MSQPFWFVGKLIIRVRLANRQSSCNLGPVLAGKHLPGFGAPLSEVRGEAIRVVQCPGRGIPRCSRSGTRPPPSSEVQGKVIRVVRGRGRGTPRRPRSGARPPPLSEVRGQAFPVAQGSGRGIPRRPRIAVAGLGRHRSWSGPSACGSNSKLSQSRSSTPAPET